MTVRGKRVLCFTLQKQSSHSPPVNHNDCSTYYNQSRATVDGNLRKEEKLEGRKPTVDGLSRWGDDGDERMREKELEV